jgi:hypothetical protein
VCTSRSRSSPRQFMSHFGVGASKRHPKKVTPDKLYPVMIQTRYNLHTTKVSVTMQRKMNTSTQPIRRSARLAARNPVVVTVRATPVPVRSRPSATPAPVKTRHSARLALRKRPNYAETEEWEVEDPIYPSNTTYRTSGDLSVSEHTKLMSEVARCKEALNRADNFTLPTTHRHCAVIDCFWVVQGMEIVIPMFPKFRATMRDKIRDFEERLQGGYCATMDPRMQLSLQDAMDVTKKALANAHRSPFYVAAV